MDLLTLKTLGPGAYRGSPYKWTPSGPVLREPPKTEEPKTEEKEMDAKQRRAFAKKHGLDHRDYFNDMGMIGWRTEMFEGRPGTMIYDTRLKSGLGGYKGSVKFFPRTFSDSFGNFPELTTWSLKQPGWSEWAREFVKYQDRMNDHLLNHAGDYKRQDKIRKEHRKVVDRLAEKYSP